MTTVETAAVETPLSCQLRGAGIGAGDEVIVASYGGDQVLAALHRVGAVPVFVDIDPRTFCLDPAAASDAVSARTAAVVPVHLFGHPADMVCLRALTQQRGLLMVQSPAELPPVTAEVKRRQAHARFLETRLTGVVTPFVEPGVEHRYEQYVVRVPGNGRPDRDVFARALRSRGVACRVPVPIPAHRLPGPRAGASPWLPQTERAAAQCLTLPVTAASDRRHLLRIVAACRALGGLVREPAC